MGKKIDGQKGGELCSDIINNTSGVAYKSDVKIIEDSGHHIYLDNIDKFNSMVTEEMKNLKTNFSFIDNKRKKR